MWTALVIAGLLARQGAGAAASEDPPAAEEPPSADEPAPVEEPPPPLEPCKPSHGSVLPGPCSPGLETPPDPSTPQWLPERGADEPPLDTPFDRRQEAMEQRLSAIVHRLDAFFGDPTHMHFEDPPEARIRLRGGFRTEQGHVFEPEGSIIADLRLPSLDERLSRASLFVTGGDERERDRGGTEQDLVPRRFGPSVRGGGGALELRLDLFRDRLTLVDAGAGIRFALPPPPYVRARVARAVELRLGLAAHGNQSVFWQRREGFGESTRVDVERVFGPRTVARLWGIATITEVSRGLEWAAENGLQQGLGRRTGVYLAAGVDGATRPDWRVDRYRVYTRLRQDIHRARLFAELEPEVAWRLDDPGIRRRRVLALTVRLELQILTRR